MMIAKLIEKKFKTGQQCYNSPRWPKYILIHPEDAYELMQQCPADANGNMFMTGLRMIKSYDIEKGKPEVVPGDIE